MAILVTGGAGYIGSHTVWALVDAGEKVVVLDKRWTKPPLRDKAWDKLPPEAILVEGRIEDKELVRKLLLEHDIDEVMHFAALKDVEMSVLQPLEYYQNNVSASIKFIETVRESRVRKFIFSSSAAVYGNSRVVPVSEDDPTEPLSPYGHSKLMIEQVLRDCLAYHDRNGDYALESQGGFPHVSLRYFNVAGYDSQGRCALSRNAGLISNVANTVVYGVKAMNHADPGIEVYGTDYPTPDGTAIRDYVHVSDIAAAHVQALKYLRREQNPPSHILNCGYGHGYSVLEVINAAKRVSGKNFNFYTENRRKGDMAVSISKADRIREVLGWVPKFDNLDTIIRDEIKCRELENQR